MFQVSNYETINIACLEAPTTVGRKIVACKNFVYDIAWLRIIDMPSW